jgi:molybdenum cofactor biosynthesis enzyme MoaA
MSTDLLEPRCKFVILELTTRCNLRCLYCALSQPSFHGHDLEIDRSGIIEEFVRMGVEDVQISGHGESTIVPGWTEVAGALERAGIRVNLTTNLSRRLSSEEIAVLAGMKCITVSCDTCDPALFARLRRPARLERVEENLALLERAFSRHESRRPYMAINCTLSAPAVPGLADLVRWAGTRGFDAISLVNLFEYPTVDPDFPVRHPANVDPRATIAKIREAREIGLDLGLDFHVMDGLSARLEEAIAS